MKNPNTGVCVVRPDILNDGETAPVGEHHLTEGVFNYRWTEDDQFQIFIEGEWEDAESADFNSIANPTQEELNEALEHFNEGITFDVHFNNDEHSDSKGFEGSFEECFDYISLFKLTGGSYFKDYSGGTVEIVCNQNGKVYYQEDIPRYMNVYELREEILNGNNPEFDILRQAVDDNIRWAWENWDEKNLQSYYEGEKPEDPPQTFVTDWVESEPFDTELEQFNDIQLLN